MKNGMYKNSISEKNLRIRMSVKGGNFSNRDPFESIKDVARSNPSLKPVQHRRIISDDLSLKIPRFDMGKSREIKYCETQRNLEKPCVGMNWLILSPKSIAEKFNPLNPIFHTRGQKRKKFTFESPAFPGKRNEVEPKIAMVRKRKEGVIIPNKRVIRRVTNLMQKQEEKNERAKFDFSFGNVGSL